MAIGFILSSIAITLALGMLLVPAIGTVVFAENMTGKDSNMTGMASNMTGMASNMTGNLTGNMTGMIGNMTG
jgi:outer membrane lipoprotein-sorting protein